MGGGGALGLGAGGALFGAATTGSGTGSGIGFIGSAGTGAGGPGGGAGARRRLRFCFLENIPRTVLRIFLPTRRTAFPTFFVADLRPRLRPLNNVLTRRVALFKKLRAIPNYSKIINYFALMASAIKL